VSDEQKQPESGEPESVDGRKLHPASIPGVMELDEDGDLLLYISPSLIRQQALREREEKRAEEYES
jgi:hypothetical protein